MVTKPDTPPVQEQLEQLFQQHGFSNFKWIDPQKIIVAQWVRMKCMYGCGNYGQNASCPPNVPSVSECERFFKEYSEAVIFHFEKKVDKPEDRHDWSKKINSRLSKLERETFINGNQRAFMLFMDSCSLCEECAGNRDECKLPRTARPSPESMAVDVFSTVRQFGFHIEVCKDYDQAMNRYAFFMVH